MIISCCRDVNEMKYVYIVVGIEISRKTRKVLVRPLYVRQGWRTKRENCLPAEAWAKVGDFAFDRQL